MIRELASGLNGAGRENVLASEAVGAKGVVWGGS